MKEHLIAALNNPSYVGVSLMFALFMFWSWARPKHFRYLLDKGTDEPSLNRIGQFTALVVTTWAVVTMVLTGTFSEAFAFLYMLTWTTAQGASLYFKLKGQALNQANENKDDKNVPVAG